jgi:hypothetical protein
MRRLYAYSQAFFMLLPNNSFAHNCPKFFRKHNAQKRYEYHPHGDG